MGSVVLLLSVIYFVFSVIATKFFGQLFPIWFGDIGRSAYTLFQIMTLESWSMGIVRPVMEQFPMAWVFFIPFILITSFAVLNLFIGIIVDAMQGLDDESEETGNRPTIDNDNTRTLHEIQLLRSEVSELKRLLLMLLPSMLLFLLIIKVRSIELLLIYLKFNFRSLNLISAFASQASILDLNPTFPELFSDYTNPISATTRIPTR